MEPTTNSSSASVWTSSTEARLRRRKPILIIAAIMTKLLHVTCGVLKSRKPFDPAYHLNHEAPPAITATDPFHFPAPFYARIRPPETRSSPSLIGKAAHVRKQAL